MEEVSKVVEEQLTSDIVNNPEKLAETVASADDYIELLSPSVTEDLVEELISQDKIDALQTTKLTEAQVGWCKESLPSIIHPKINWVWHEI